MTDDTPKRIEEALPDTLEDEAKALEEAQGSLSPVSFAGMWLGERTIKALESMAYEGLPLSIAAERAGLLRHNLKRAFDTPSVRAVYNQAVASVRDGEAIRAYNRMVILATTSKSDNVRMEANKWLAGVDGIAALKRVEGQMHHQHSFAGYGYSKPERMLNVTPDNPSVGEDL